MVEYAYFNHYDTGWLWFNLVKPIIVIITIIIINLPSGMAFTTHEMVILGMVQMAFNEFHSRWKRIHRWSNWWSTAEDSRIRSTTCDVNWRLPDVTSWLESLRFESGSWLNMELVCGGWLFYRCAISGLSRNAVHLWYTYGTPKLSQLEWMIIYTLW